MDSLTANPHMTNPADTGETYSRTPFNPATVSRSDLSDADKLLWAHKYVACLESAVERQSAAEIVYAAFLDAARRADASDPPSTSFTLFDFPDGTSRYMYVSPARGASATSEGPIPGSVGPKHGGVALPAIIKTDCSS